MKVQFTIPLRIKGIHGDTSSMDDEQLAHRAAQIKFHKTIQCIGDGKEDDVNVILMNYDNTNHKRTILIPGVCVCYLYLCNACVFCSLLTFNRYEVHHKGTGGVGLFVSSRV